MSAATLRPSPIDAVREAMDHTKRFLFPFRLERWFVLGFVAFLDQCGRGGGAPFPGGGGRFGGGDGGGGGADLDDVATWLGSHIGLVIALAGAGFTLVVAVSALVLWLGSRGVFMYLDDVATGRADVARPWREHRERAWSLFGWRFGLALATLLAVLLLLVLVGGLVLVTAKAHAAQGVAVAIGLLVFLPLLLLVALASGLASLALRDFVAPLQWRLGVPCGEAVNLFLRLLRQHPGAFGLYALLKLLFQMIGGVALLAACCLTCCCAALPVVAQTLLQPLFFFERAWSLYFLRQLGYDVFEPVTVATPAPGAP